MGQETVISTDQANRLSRRLALVQRLTLAGVIPFDEAMLDLKGLVERFAPGEIIGQPTPERDIAEERLVETVQFYSARGIHIPIPKPMLDDKVISNREFERRRKANQELFYRHSDKLLSYQAFMTANGQAKHWTVAEEAERKKIIWEATEEGYWFWAEVPERCPGLGETWNDLSGSIRLLSLEEYVVVFHATKFLTSLVIDVTTWCWLRTRCKTASGLGALRTYGDSGQVGVFCYSSEGLSELEGNDGGRSSEVVKRAA